MGKLATREENARVALAAFPGWDIGGKMMSFEEMGWYAFTLPVADAVALMSRCKKDEDKMFMRAGALCSEALALEMVERYAVYMFKKFSVKGRLRLIIRSILGGVRFVLVREVVIRIRRLLW